MQASNLQQEANLISRMERMPLNKALLTLVGLLSWCWVMEAFDLGMIGQVVAVLKKIWDLDASTLGLLGSCSTAGVVIGTASAGFLTDRFGRKRILLWGVFIFTFFTLIGSLYENLAWIVTMRFIGGLGAGAVFPIIADGAEITMEIREERKSLLYKVRGAGVRYGGRSPDVKTSRGDGRP